MAVFKAELIEKISRTPSIKSFRFKAEKKLDFLPGQFSFVMLDSANPQNRNLNKYLSFSSSPLNDYFEVTKKLSQSEFSKKLDSLKIGDEVNFHGPLGKCVFKDEFKKIVFLVGGIGITPVISIIEYIYGKKLDTDALLVYSNRVIEEIALKKELDEWKKQALNIKIVYTITDCKVEGNECVQGRIDKKVLAEKVGDIPQRKVFIFGPPRMVEAVKQLCLENGCDQDSIMAENFVGY